MHTVARGLVEGCNDAGVDQRIHLGNDARLAAGPRIARLVRNLLEKTAVEGKGRTEQLVELGRLAD